MRPRGWWETCSRAEGVWMRNVFCARISQSLLTSAATEIFLGNENDFAVGAGGEDGLVGFGGFGEGKFFADDGAESTVF